MPSCGDGSATHSRPRARTRSPGAKFTVIRTIPQTSRSSRRARPRRQSSGNSNSVQPLASAASRAALRQGREAGGDKVTAPGEAHLLTGEADGRGVRGRKPGVLEGARPSTASRRPSGGRGEHHLPPRQIDQHLFRFIARSVDQLVIGLVEVGEQAAIAPADAGLPIVIDEAAWRRPPRSLRRLFRSA